MEGKKHRPDWIRAIKGFAENAPGLFAMLNVYCRLGTARSGNTRHRGTDCCEALVSERGLGCLKCVASSESRRVNARSLTAFWNAALNPLPTEVLTIRARLYCAMQPPKSA